jgi:penicillin amidase
MVPLERDDITEYMDFSKNPSAVNQNGTLYSANNQAEAVDGFLYPGYYLPEDRAKRITQLLEPKSDWTKESVGKMLNDNTSLVAIVVKNLISGLEASSLSKMKRSCFYFKLVERNE